MLTKISSTPSGKLQIVFLETPSSPSLRGVIFKRALLKTSLTFDFLQKSLQVSLKSFKICLKHDQNKR